VEALALAALELLTTIAKMVADAKNAKDEQHAAIVARLQAATAALTAAEIASDALAAEGEAALAGK